MTPLTTNCPPPAPPRGRSARPIGPRRSGGETRRGFTLVETALAVIIVGVGFVASMQLFAACTRENQFANQVTVAVNLAEAIGEVTQGLPFNDPGSGRAVFGPELDQGEEERDPGSFDDVDDFDQTDQGEPRGFNPPIDAMRRPLPELSQYTQLVTVVPVNPMDPDSNASGNDVPRTNPTGAVRVKVRVMYQASPASPTEEVYRASWIRFER